MIEIPDHVDLTINLKGDVEFGIGEETTWGAPGTLVHLPAGTQHWFRFGKGGAVMMSITSQLGASKMFADFAREISPTSPDLGKLVELASLHGCTINGRPECWSYKQNHSNYLAAVC